MIVHLVLQRSLRGDAARAIPSAPPALVLLQLAPQHPVAAHGPALAVHTHAPDAVLKVTRGTVHNLN